MAKQRTYGAAEAADPVQVDFRKDEAMGKRRSQRRGNATDRLSQFQSGTEPATLSGTGSLAGSSDGFEEYAAPRRDFGEQVRRQTDMLAQNPLGLALGGLALGFLGGMLLPVSDVEREKLGDVGNAIGDQVETQMRAIGQDVVEHGKAVLVETVQAALLDGKNPVEAAQQAASDHLTTVATNAQTRVEESLKSSAN